MLNVTIIYCRENRQFPSRETFYGWQESNRRDLKWQHAAELDKSLSTQLHSWCLVLLVKWNKMNVLISIEFLKDKSVDHRNSSSHVHTCTLITSNIGHSWIQQRFKIGRGIRTALGGRVLSWDGWMDTCWCRSRKAVVLFNIAEQKVSLQNWQALPSCHKTCNLLSLSSPLPLSLSLGKHN